MAIRLLALDIDGTLTANSENIVSPRCLEAIRSARGAGVFVTIATGRSNLATRPIWEAIGLSGPSIQFGGAWIVDAPDGTLIDQQPLAPDIVRDVMRFAREIHVDAQIYLGDTVVVAQPNPYTARYVARNGMHVLVDPDVYTRLYENVPKILAFSEEEERTRTLFEAKFAGRVHTTRSQSAFIEINDRLATKGHALERLAARMGVLQSEVAAMGDSYLDLDMIRWAGTGVCMADSIPEIQRISDVIAPDYLHDGVAWFIENYILV